METFTWKKELKSFLITFAVGFAMVLYDQLDTLNLDSLSDGALLGVIFGGVRAGFKRVVELFISIYSKK